MSIRLLIGYIVAFSLSAVSVNAATSELADAAMARNALTVRSLLQKKADVNAPQVDGTTALHWAVRYDDLDTADLLIRSGARVSTANREGVTPLQLAAMNGSASMIDKLLKAGADANAALTPSGDTALMMAARTGTPEAITVLLEAGANVNAKESWGGTTALMWAASEQHAAAVKLLLDHGADVNARSNFVAAANGRGFEGRTPAAPKAEQKVEEFASGWLTPLMFAAREGDLESARLLVNAGANVNAIAGDGKDALGLAIFNGNYDFRLLPHRQQVGRQSRRHAGLHAAVLGGGPPQHGDGAEFSVDDHGRSAAAHQEAARRGRQPERTRQQHTARPHARRVAAHRVCDSIDARCLLSRPRASEDAAVVQGRPQDHLQ
jgi:ankyrin repeat protein